jgi:hypothetical protein
MYEMTVDTERRCVMTTWGSLVTDTSLMDYQKTVWNDPAVHGFDEVIDFQAVDTIEVTTEGLEAVAHAAAGMDVVAGSGRFAIVVGDGLPYGLSRMYEVFRELEASASREVMTFKRMEEALAWLDRAPETP